MTSTSVMAEAAGRVLESAAADPPDGFDAPLWTRLEESGFDKLLLSEDEGGAGDVFEDAAAMMARLGSRAAAIPLAETLVANWCLAQAGLPVPDGPKALVAGPAPTDAAVLSGRLTWSGPIAVPWLPVAGALVLVAPDGGGGAVIALAEPLEGAHGETLAGEPILTVRPLAEGLPVVRSAALARDGALPLALLALLKAAAMVGAFGPVVEMSVEHANTRKQFGRSIAAFQAVQHMIARMASEAAAAAAAVQFASRAENDETLAWGAAIAKARASEAAGIVAAMAHQVHGAIGFTREYGLHRFTRRLWSWRDEAGNEGYWNARIGRSAILSADEL